MLLKFVCVKLFCSMLYLCGVKQTNCIKKLILILYYYYYYDLTFNVCFFIVRTKFESRMFQTFVQDSEKNCPDFLFFVCSLHKVTKRLKNFLVKLIYFSPLFLIVNKLTRKLKTFVVKLGLTHTVEFKSFSYNIFITK